NHLRELYWYAEGYRAKKTAEVLAVHPSPELKRSARGEPDRGDREASKVDYHPLVVHQFVGSGRCMFFGFDETWRWGYREDQGRFNQFWVQTVRYLSRSRLGRVQLRLADEQAIYRRGDKITVVVRFPDDQPPPEKGTPVEVKVQRRVADRPGEVFERVL